MYSACTCNLRTFVVKGGRGGVGGVGVSRSLEGSFCSLSSEFLGEMGRATSALEGAGEREGLIGDLTSVEGGSSDKSRGVVKSSSTTTGLGSVGGVCSLTTNPGNPRVTARRFL